MIFRHIDGAADQGLALDLQRGHRFGARYDADGTAAVGPAVAQQGKGRDLRFGGKGGDEGKDLIGGQRALPCLGGMVRKRGGLLADPSIRKTGLTPVRRRSGPGPPDRRYST